MSPIDRMIRIGEWLLISRLGDEICKWLLIIAVLYFVFQFIRAAEMLIG